MSATHDYTEQTKLVAQKCPATVAYMVERRLVQIGHERSTLCSRCGMLAYLHRATPSGVPLSTLSLSSLPSSASAYSAPVPVLSSKSSTTHHSHSASVKVKKKEYDKDESYTHDDREYDEDENGNSTPIHTTLLLSALSN